MVKTVAPGVRVIIKDAYGAEHEAEDLSGVEDKGHTFPVVWVNRPLHKGGFEPWPWPAEDVRVADDA